MTGNSYIKNTTKILEFTWIIIMCYKTTKNYTILKVLR